MSSNSRVEEIDVTSPKNGVSRRAEPREHFDAVVVGAGFAGLYMLHRLRDTLGLHCRVYEAGDDVGGTWYWNRYPGARCDSESLYYTFSDRMSKELLQEWNWTERYAGQPEILRYIKHVAETFDLYKDIRFSTRVVDATYDEESNRWLVTADDGHVVTAAFLITAVGCLSAANVPEFKGRQNFLGSQFHTGLWPHEGVDFTGKRVAVIGTGSTGVQLIPEIAQHAAHVYVMQRTPNYCVAGRNASLDAEVVRAVKANLSSIWELMRSTSFGHPIDFPDRSALSVTEEDRRDIYEAAWSKGGIPIAFTFNDLVISRASNETAAEFVRAKIREVVRDPDVAELLSPKDHPIFTRRVPLENGYYETFNRENVTLVDLRSSPIEEFTAAGIRTGDAEYEVDIIVFATGFDAVTGSLFKLGIHGRDGISLQEHWREGPRTYLGLATRGFPNLFMITGPQSPSVLSNMVVSIEQHVDWITNCLRHMRERGVDVVEPLPDAEMHWVTHHNEVANATLVPTTNSWWVGSNVPGKLRRIYPYLGGVGNYRAVCEQVAARDYDGFHMSVHDAAAVARGA